MLIEFDTQSLGRQLPASWSERLRRVPGGVKAVGDPTGLAELYLHPTDDKVVVADDIGEILDAIRATGGQAEIDPFGLSSILHHAHIPIPHTVYRDIRFLGMGDTATIGQRSGKLSVSFSSAYPYLNHRSAQNQRPDTKALLDLLTAATDRQVAAAGNSGVLMLSSGKDSISVALALAEAGLKHIQCVTYRAGDDDPEPAIAADVCRRLGLQHEIIDLPPPGARTEEAMTAFFRTSPIPSGHSSQIPYATILHGLSIGSGAVLDGGGNDAYMGFLPSRQQSTKQRFRIRSRGVASLVSSRLYPDSPINYLARSRAEATLPQRTLRYADTKRLYPDAVDTRQWWYELSRETRHLDLVDLGNLTISHHVGSSAAMQKMRLAARLAGLEVSMPFCDQPLIDYFFNLPESSRFNRRTGENKILLRRMLLRYLDYDAAEIGKHYFSFDGAEFIRANRAYVRHEINECDLWADTGLDVADELLSRLESRPLLGHSLIVLFLVSGWYNHSVYLRGP